MSTITELQKKYGVLVREAENQAKQWEGREAEMPKETAEKIAGILGQSDELKAQIDLYKRLEGHSGSLEEAQGTKAAHLGWRQSAKGEGMPEVDEKAWREIQVKTFWGQEKRVRFQVPLSVQAKGYKDAFESYLRKGMEYMGPNDRKTLTEGVDEAGGFTVPENYQTEMIRKIATTAAVRALARVLTTSRDQIKWPRISYTADDKYTSGVRLTWTGESPASATVHRVTDPVIGLMTIPVHTSMASLPLSNDLLEDSAFDMLGLGSDLIGEAFALGEDDVFISGTGDNKPMGMNTRVAVGTELIGTVNSGHASQVTADGLIDLFYGLPAQYRANAQFLMNSDTAKEIRKLKDGSNRYLWDALNGGLSSNAVQESVLGRRVNYDEFMPDIAASAEPILFGDFSGYFIVDRVGLSIQRLSELYAETNVTLLLARRRVGGDVTQPWRIKAQTISA